MFRMPRRGIEPAIIDCFCDITNNFVGALTFITIVTKKIFYYYLDLATTQKYSIAHILNKSPTCLNISGE